MFDAKIIESTVAFYNTIDRWKDIQNFRKLTPQIKGIKNLFYGDSITQVWPLQEFFPGYSILNRGIGGDNVHGLYYRVNDDVFPYAPQRVLMMIGINGIEDEKAVDRITALAEIISNRQIEVFLCSVLPLRYPDNWNRFQYQDKIVRDNAKIKQWAEQHVAGFIDYHSAMKDETGQLSAAYAQPDGTHLTFEGYYRMAEVVRPYLLQ